MNPLHLIANNLIGQILAFQQAVTEREEGKRFATIAESSMQCKMVATIMRLLKPPAAPRKPTTQQAENTESPEDNFTANAVELQMMLHNANAAHEEAKPIQPPLQAAPPLRKGMMSNKITPQDFEEYKHHIGKLYGIRDHDTIKFNGEMVNAKWLEYNLFQYCLPSGQRKFIDDVREVLQTTDHERTQEEIRKHMAIHYMLYMAD